MKTLSAPIQALLDKALAKFPLNWMFPNITRALIPEDVHAALTTLAHDIAALGAPAVDLEKVCSALRRLHIAILALSKTEGKLTLFEASPTKSQAAFEAWRELNDAQKLARETLIRPAVQPSDAEADRQCVIESMARNTYGEIYDEIISKDRDGMVHGTARLTLAKVLALPPQARAALVRLLSATGGGQ